MSHRSWYLRSSVKVRYLAPAGSPCRCADIQTIPCLGTCVKTGNEDYRHPGSAIFHGTTGGTRTHGDAGRQGRHEPTCRDARQRRAGQARGQSRTNRSSHIIQAEKRQIYHDYPSKLFAAFFAGSVGRFSTATPPIFAQQNSDPPLRFWLTVWPEGAVPPRAGKRNRSG